MLRFGEAEGCPRPSPLLSPPSSGLPQAMLLFVCGRPAGSGTALIHKAPATVIPEAPATESAIMGHSHLC